MQQQQKTAKFFFVNELILGIYKAHQRDEVRERLEILNKIVYLQKGGKVPFKWPYFGMVSSTSIHTCLCVDGANCFFHIQDPSSLDF